MLHSCLALQAFLHYDVNVSQTNLANYSCISEGAACFSYMLLTWNRFSSGASFHWFPSLR